MDQSERAALVREARLEMKTGKRYRNNPWSLPADGFNEREPTSRDNATDYVNNASGGDSTYYDRAARWDRYRAQQPKRRRIRMARAERDGPDGYVGYTGQWANHFNYSTPAARRSAGRKRRL